MVFQNTVSSQPQYNLVFGGKNIFPRRFEIYNESKTHAMMFSNREKSLLYELIRRWENTV
jgi:hypothetical protein